VEAMAEYYLELVRRQQPNGPYALVGYSLGGLIVFEMARQLRLAGENVDFLGIIDADFHESCLPFRERVPFEMKRTVRRVLLAATAPREKLLPRVTRALPRLPLARETALDDCLPSHQRVSRATREAGRTYRPQSYGGSATFFQGKARRLKFCDPHPATTIRIWSHLVEGGLVLRRVSGGHANILNEPHVKELACVLSACLAANQSSPDDVPLVSR
jgi:acetoacetyl-CoA synthetase